ncbi:MAG: quinolinate synthase NadA [Bacteroidales bacterium]|nr:quinolinate synthase NadA [Bacteroidales bacterium]
MIDYVQEIKRLKKEKNAIILAHYYQIPEIQDIADYIGDSLGLAQAAVQTKADIIVFAGVHFMAETAKMLNPNKMVLLPDLEAGCSLAASCNAVDFAKFRAKYPDHIVLSYINCTADIKALSDVIVTSGNAVQIVESFPKNQKIIFAPDKNLGAYINRITNRNMVLWDGVCEVHNQLKTETIIKLKQLNPEAKVVAHPECDGPILALADMIGSTTAMLKYTENTNFEKYIIASETGILHKMQKNSPQKKFLVVPADETCNCNDCPYMKLNTMEKLYLAMKNESPNIELSKELIEKAKKPIISMLDISKKLGLI